MLSQMQMYQIKNFLITFCTSDRFLQPLKQKTLFLLVNFISAVNQYLKSFLSLQDSSWPPFVQRFFFQCATVACSILSRKTWKQFMKQQQKSLILIHPGKQLNRLLSVTLRRMIQSLLSRLLEHAFITGIQYLLFWKNSVTISAVKIFLEWHKRFVMQNMNFMCPLKHLFRQSPITTMTRTQFLSALKVQNQRFLVTPDLKKLATSEPPPQRLSGKRSRRR